MLEAKWIRLLRMLSLLATAMALACGGPVPAPRTVAVKKTAPAEDGVRPAKKKRPAKTGARTISIIKGRLKAHLIEQEITANRVFKGIAYVSNGLRALGQKEILIVLALPVKGQSPPGYFEWVRIF